MRCQRSGRECVPAPGKSEELSFRHGQNPSLRGKGPPRYGESDLAFPNDQVWVESSSECMFCSALLRVRLVQVFDLPLQIHSKMRPA